MCINHFAIFRVVFHSRTDATPEAGFRLGIDSVMTGTHRREIHKTTLFMFLRGKNMIVQSSFLIIQIRLLWIVFEKLFGQFQHIVGIAGFGAFNTFNHSTEIGRWIEMFTHTVSTDNR